MVETWVWVNWGMMIAVVGIIFGGDWVRVVFVCVRLE